MMRKLALIIIVFAFILPEISHSQDTILTLDGIRLNTKILKENENEVVYTLPENKFKSIQRLNNVLKGWSIGLGGGTMITHNELSGVKSLRAAFNIDLNRRINPFLTLQGEYTPGKLYGEKSYTYAFNRYFETTLNEFTLNAILDLTHLFYSSSQEKLPGFGAYLKAGIGLLNFRAIERVIDSNDTYISSYGFNNKGETFAQMERAMVYPLGIGVSFKLSSSLDLKLEGLNKYTNTKKLEADLKAKYPVYYSSLIFGITYKLGKQNLSNERTIDKADIYYLKYSNGKTVITYKGDSTANAESMLKYIEGEEYAIKTYKPVISTIGSVVAGLTGGYLAFYGALIPTAYVIGSSSVSPSVKNRKGKALIPENKLNDKYFIRGYKDKARKIEIKRTVVGGLAGLTAMIIIKSIHFQLKN